MDANIPGASRQAPELAASGSAPPKRPRETPPSGLSLLQRARDAARLGTRTCIFALWAKQPRSHAPQLVYFCDRLLPQLWGRDPRDALLRLAAPRLLCGQAPHLVAVTDLAGYESQHQLQQGSQHNPPALPVDVRRSLKERMQRLTEDAEACADGVFVAFFVTAGHKTAAKQLAGGCLARALFCSEDWHQEFEGPMLVPRTSWPPHKSRVELEPGSLEWYAAFLDFGCGFFQYPTRDSLLLPDVVLGETASGAPASYRIMDKPVHVQIQESAADLGAPRLTCTCRNYSDLASVLRGCLHTQYAQLITLPQPGPGPPVHVPMPRGAQTPRSTVLPGDFFWLPDRTLVACAAQTGSIRCTRSGCTRSGCGEECRHIKQVKEVFRTQLPSAAPGPRQKPSSAGPGPAGGQAGSATATACCPPVEAAWPPPPSVRYPFPCDPSTANAMAAWEASITSAQLRAADLQAAAGASSSSGGGGGDGGGGGSGGGGVLGSPRVDLVPPMPNGGRCACGNAYSPELVRGGPVVVYGPDTVGPLRAQLYQLNPGCCRESCVRTYDGAADGLFRYSSRSFFSLRHMYGYAVLLLRCGANAQAYVKAQHDLASATLPPDPGRPPQFSETLFRLAWQQFEARLDRCHTFICPICQLCPRKLVCDGTAVTYQILHYCGVPVTTLAPVAANSVSGSSTSGSGGGSSNSTSGATPHREHTRADRCWCPTEEGRAALRGFSHALLGNGRDVYGRGVAGWVAAPDMAALSSRLHADCRGVTIGLLGVLSAATSSVGGAPGSSLRMGLARLVDCLGSTAPACAYLPAACLPVAGVWLATHHPSVRQLQEQQQAQQGQAQAQEQQQQWEWNDAIAMRSLAALLEGHPSSG